MPAIRDGVIVRLDGYEEPEAALAAAGERVADVAGERGAGPRLDAFNRRDWAAALALWDEDAEIVAGGVVMEGDYTATLDPPLLGEHIRGHPRPQRRGRRNARPGDLTLGAARVRGHGAGSDTPFDEMTWESPSGVTGNASGGATTRPKPKLGRRGGAE